MLLFRSPFPCKIRIKKCTFTYDRKVNSGSFGDVVLYKDQNDKEIVIKFFKDDGKDEAGYEESIINALNQGECQIINSRILNIDNPTKCVIMEKMDGSLLNLYELISKNIQLTLLKQLFLFLKMSMIECLFIKHKMYYVDIKLENILYKQDKDKDNYTFFLGDLSSIITEKIWDKSNNALITYPSIYNRKYDLTKDYNRSQHPSLHDIRYGIGLLILRMTGLLTNYLEYSWQSNGSLDYLKMNIRDKIIMLKTKYTDEEKFINEIYDFITNAYPN